MNFQAWLVLSNWVNSVNLITKGWIRGKLECQCCGKWIPWSDVTDETHKSQNPWFFSGNGLPLPMNSSTLGLTIPPPPGFPLQVDNIHYFPLWIPMARSIPNSTNLSEMAMDQEVYMNFNKFQHIPLSNPTTLSVSKVQPDFKMPVPFSYQRYSLPPTWETTVQELDKLLVNAIKWQHIVSVSP